MTTQAAQPFALSAPAARTAGKRHRCPACHKRGALVCVYSAPAEYSEPAPRYFRCESCAARFLRTGLFGQFVDASDAVFDAAFVHRD